MGRGQDAGFGVVGVAYDSDLDQVKELLGAIVPEIDGVLAEPPRAMVYQFGASSIGLAIHSWPQSDTATTRRVGRGGANGQARHSMKPVSRSRSRNG
ncbi:MAG TPA: hypothetical protein VIW46_04045 [Acidimicrobiia bacterium]